MCHSLLFFSQYRKVPNKATRRCTLPTKLCMVNAMVFPVVMYRCESWTIKAEKVKVKVTQSCLIMQAEHQRTDAFGLWCWRRLESPLDCKIKAVNPTGSQFWIFIGRTDAETKVPILRTPRTKRRLIGKDPDGGKHWRQEEKRTTEDKMIGWCHWFNGYEWEQTPGDSEGQGSLACFSPWGRKESDTTEQQLRTTTRVHELKELESRRTSHRRKKSPPLWVLLFMRKKKKKSQQESWNFQWGPFFFFFFWPSQATDLSNNPQV